MIMPFKMLRRVISFAEQLVHVEYIIRKWPDFPLAQAVYTVKIAAMPVEHLLLIIYFLVP